MPYDKNVLAANLRAFRARARMKQSEVAAAVGVTANTIMNYENGEGGIGYETAWDHGQVVGRQRGVAQAADVRQPDGRVLRFEAVRARALRAAGPRRAQGWVASPHHRLYAAGL